MVEFSSGQHNSDTLKTVEALKALRDRLESAFAADTAAPGYHGSTASGGHCAVVATIIHHLFGGLLVSARVNSTSHWFNRITLDRGELDVDLTGDQFGLPSVQMQTVGQLYPDARVRSYLDLNIETLERVARLARRSGL